MEQIEVWQKAVEGYKETYFGIYGHQPKEKLVESFCREYKIPWPLPRVEEFEIKDQFTISKIDMFFGKESEG